MKLNEALLHMVMYCDCPIEVQIIQRDENGCGIGVKRIPISRVKPDFDGRGVVIQIEDRDVGCARWQRREEIEQ